MNSQFYRSFWRSNLVSCERVAPDKLKSQFYLSFWRSNLVSCEKVARDTFESQFYLSFWRSGCVSCHLARTAPAPAFRKRNRKEGEGKRGGSGTGSALVPATGSVIPTSGAPAANPAGTSPTPMTVDDGIFYKPVQAYFQCVQDNFTYISEVNIDLFRQEAEQRMSGL